MDLLIKIDKETDGIYANRQKEVFLFDGTLGEKVWESEPITRFQFKQPFEDSSKIFLVANHPTAGIVFEGVPYIGTNDGMIYTPQGKIQRIQYIHVDPELFFDTVFPFANDQERSWYLSYRENGLDAALEGVDGLLRDVAWKSLIEIDTAFMAITNQRKNLDRYLISRLRITGFVTTTTQNKSQLFDGSLIGIAETLTGTMINELAPQTLYQVSPYKSGFVPSGTPNTLLEKYTIERGIERTIPIYAVDYRSLWNLKGTQRLVEGICPRDGRGDAPGRFATDGKIAAISHGPHPFFNINISRISEEGLRVNVKSLGSKELEPACLPKRLFMRDGQVFGDYGNAIRNFSIGKGTGRDIFKPRSRKITSIADSGLITLLDESSGRTAIYDPFATTNKELDSFKGQYVFLSATPQR